jgi:ubiquinone/menaquinone biosynthesis C-methylase UbiE
VSNPALAYEKDNVPAIFGPCADLLLEAADPQPGERVLDVACGTGAVARRAARRVEAGGGVDAIDLSPHMLAVAREVAEADGTAIEFHQGQMEELPFSDGEFDLVLCQHGLQFSADRPGAVAEFHRVLRPGGRLAVCTWKELTRHPYLEALDRVVEQHTGIAALRAPFSLHAESEIRELMEGAGFRVSEVREAVVDARFPDPHGYLEHEADTLVAALPALQHLEGEQREQLRLAVVTGMQDAVAAATIDGELVVPFHAMLALGVRD